MIFISETPSFAMLYGLQISLNDCKPMIQNSATEVWQRKNKKYKGLSHENRSSADKFSHCESFHHVLLAV
jgi:hypothetical protein